MMYPTVEERVAAGMALLDDHCGPGWRNKVIPSQIETRSCEDCVLGQVYGEYSRGCVDLGLWSEDRPDHLEPAKLGFAINTDTLDSDLLPDGAVWGYTDEMFARLDAEWERVLA